MNIDCSQIIKNYLLNQNPLYAFSFPLSLLIAIIIFGIAKTYNWSNNSYINQILIPIVAFLLTMVLIDVISRSMLNKAKVNMLVNQCKNFKEKPNILNKILNMTSKEGFTSNMLRQSMPIPNNNPPIIPNNNPPIIPNNNPPSVPLPIPNNLYPSVQIPVDLNLNETKNQSYSDPFDTIPHIEPAPLEYTTFSNAMCIQPSNCCSLCSGSPDSNPCNLVAPIPGPQWIPQSAENVQNRLKNNQYSESLCPIQG